MPADELPPEEPLLDDIVKELRAPLDLRLDLERTVIARLESERASLATPLRVPVRRHIRYGWAAGVVLFALGGVGAALWTERAVGTGARRGGPNPIRFALQAPASSQVTVVGDFNNWDPNANPLSRSGDEWSALIPLRPGRYRYTFLVDGRRLMADPGTPPAADDDFGAPTSAITVAN